VKEGTGGVVFLKKKLRATSSINQGGYVLGRKSKEGKALNSTRQKDRQIASGKPPGGQTRKRKYYVILPTSKRADHVPCEKGEKKGKPNRYKAASEGGAGGRECQFLQYCERNKLCKGEKAYRENTLVGG